MKAWLGKPGLAATLSPLFLLLAVPASSPAQQPATIAVEVTNPQIAPPRWKLSFDATGQGSFDAEADGVTQPGRGVVVLGEIHQPLQLSASFAAHAFAVAHQRKLFAFPCESHMKVAFQGMKRFSYTGPDGSGSCEFNFSKDKSIQELSESFMAVENTLLYGARLEKLLQHDRLGIDKEMEDLATAAHNGMAIELGVIRPTLTRIAGDEQVLERARRKARLLLTQAN
ncbi:MAG TPA: hypothetical protein VL346_01505 [Acidobacteriaceae bacterium]|nr:hypothetical protein [Acidobacteriaceae bacterium]